MTGAGALTGIVTTDIAAVTRGRFVASSAFEKMLTGGVGWLQANLSLTPFNVIAHPNPWGSSGDLRLLPDAAARFRTAKTGSDTPFDMVPGNLVELDGQPWGCCTRSILANALDDLKAQTGLTIVAAFEHEFKLLEAGLPREHVMSFAGLRRVDGFASQVMEALDEAGLKPEVIISEYGEDQFEVTNAPSTGLAAADRAVALREIIREIARNRGWKASFAPKTSPSSVGNGVHIHFSLVGADGQPASYNASGPSGLSEAAGAFCAGILKHLPAITALTASSVSSYFRLKPHNWSSSYTWLGDKDREATLRICPTVTISGNDPAKSFNVEYRAADATANPYLALAAIVRAGLEGLKARLPCPPVHSGDPDELTEVDRAELGLRRLPKTLEDALEALQGDPVVVSWFPKVFLDTFTGMKAFEIKSLEGLDEEATCASYRAVY